MLEGDIKGYFDNIDHQLLANKLETVIKDKNLIAIYWKLVKAGYVNDGPYEKSEFCVLQGGVLSPLLSNLYLHDFDMFMEKLCDIYTTDTKVSKINPEYSRIKRLIGRSTEEAKAKAKAKALKALLIKIPANLRDDTTGTRVYYNRYADD
jgi:RNA-directed DNA polymerase